MKIERALGGDVLTFRIADELAAADDGDILARSGRTARTLIKDHSLRVTVQLLAPGVYIAMNGKHFEWNKVRKNRETGVFEAT